LLQTAAKDGLLVAVTARVSARIAEVEDFVEFTHLREQERWSGNAFIFSSRARVFAGMMPLSAHYQLDLCTGGRRANVSALRMVSGSRAITRR
jgi:hypothetical protein